MTCLKKVWCCAIKRRCRIVWREQISALRNACIATWLPESRYSYFFRFIGQIQNVSRACCTNHLISALGLRSTGLFCTDKRKQEKYFRAGGTKMPEDFYAIVGVSASRIADRSCPSASGWSSRLTG
jgi:hypothetical protein